MAYTNPTDPTTGELITAARMKTDWNDNIRFFKPMFNDSGHLSPTAGSQLTLATDACTPTQNIHKIETEAAAGTDNLSTLTIAGNVRAGHLLWLYASNVSHVVTVKHNVGNIQLRGGDFVMNVASKILMLQLIGTTWYEVARAGATQFVEVVDFVGYKETKTAPAIASNVLTIDLAAGTLHEVTVNANITTMTLSNIPASGKLGSFMLSLVGNGTGYSFDWFARTGSYSATGAIWPGGVAPTRTSTNAKKDVYTFLTWDGGTTWYGFVGGQVF